MGKQPALGVCYYPEHWPEALWAQDAAEMVAAGISYVRIAEFSWIKMEPEPGQYEFGWLDKAIDILGQAGLKVILCTPTATPPKWLLDQMPDMIAIDEEGRPRGYGSRRHYSFSHRGYRAACETITEILAKRYGTNPYVAAWQTDNEYGCHDTALSWCESARDHFRLWLAKRYGTIEALNEAWGTIFWSMSYRHFDEIELPNLTVTEANPSHNMDFRRFATHEIVSFDRAQTDILRRHSSYPISHNFMGDFNQFDARAVASHLDIAAWDSYPIGFLQNLQDKARRDPKLEADCYRVGDPDFQAFHHDLYRAMGRLWIVEQQPGPVNWAAYNPIPAEGAVRLWSWEAIAHDAELVSYFRWRQAPFAQEQMHAGLKYRNNDDAPGMAEAQQLAQELSGLTLDATTQAPIALIHDYEADWMTELDGQSRDFYYLRLLLDVYRAIRENGGSVDVVGPDADFSGYQLICAPSLMTMSDALMARLIASGAHILAGPRTGLKTDDFQLPPELTQSSLAEATGFTTQRVDALPAHLPQALSYEGEEGSFSVWREAGQMSGQGQGQSHDGFPVLVHGNQASYLCGWPDAKTLRHILSDMMQKSGLTPIAMPPYLRVRARGKHLIFTHYGPEPVTIPEAFAGKVILGDRQMAQTDVTILEI